MSIHRLIREGRQRLGMSEQQFADAVGVSRGAVQQWEKPGGTAPKRTNQPHVARLLGISVAELLSGGSNIGPGVGARAEVPLVSEVVAGNYTVIDNYKPKNQFETVPVTVPVKRHTYALRVSGDSMVSETGDSFPEGAIVIVEPEMEAVPGDYVIALNANNETTFKQLVKDGGELYLKPLNTRYPIRPLGKAAIIGVVREFSKRFR
ncbi:MULTISPECIES: LexA family transcriptional regulator [unclassified Variovorax]|jgi:SOS-response transcriptional repressor LexA|uniref:LexA family protein n=1 Tax=unclassified Variovorax TaxID=663243 RepID=UPI001160387A|nr:MULTISPECIES: S24 family peptidase [unclassified Variovorax]